MIEMSDSTTLASAAAADPEAATQPAAALKATKSRREGSLGGELLRSESSVSCAIHYPLSLSVTGVKSRARRPGRHTLAYVIAKARRYATLTPSSLPSTVGSVAAASRVTLRWGSRPSNQERKASAGSGGLMK